MSLIEREINAIFEKKELEWQEQELENKSQEIEREKIIRIGQKLISRAVSTFKNIDEFKIAAVDAVLPDTNKPKSKNESLYFALNDTLIEVNFYPYKLFNNYSQFNLTLINPDLTLENLSISTYHASSDNPVYRIRASRSSKDAKVDYYGAMAALKGIEMIRKIKHLAVG